MRIQVSSVKEVSTQVMKLSKGRVFLDTYVNGSLVKRARKVKNKWITFFLN